MKTLPILLILTIGLLSHVQAGNNEKDEQPAGTSAATSTIAGTIVDDETGETLTGVEVRLEGTDKKTYTDFEGKFVFDHINPGKYSVEANIISYCPEETRSIDVNSKEMHTFNFELKTLDKE
ncbi:MAG: carboxypeptidase-like regulatory domain-containing protein [Marinilabiliaceae bacterium]